MNFTNTNPHPTGKKIGDCVIRAIAIAENKKWIDVYDDLCSLGHSMYLMPNDKKVYEKYLETLGWEKMPMPKDNGKRIKLSLWADALDDRLFIASVVKHLTVIDKGVLLDTWNCGSKCIGNYFIKN